MKNLSKKTLSILGVLLAIVLIGVIGYSSYSKNRNADEFTTYVDEYKIETSTYDLGNKKEDFDTLIRACESAIVKKDYKKIENLKSNLSELKEEILKSNIESINKSINELESIDISKLDDNEYLLSKIGYIKTLRDENKFIKANEDFVAIKEEINTKLETIRVEEEKKHVEEELIKNIDGSYNYSSYNKNGVVTKGYDLNIITYGENKLAVSGGHFAIKNINKENEFINIEDATKEDTGYISTRSGSIAGNKLDYIGNLTWQGFIWDDQGNNQNIFGDDFLVPMIPIEVIIENSNNLVVTIGEGASVPRGTNTLTKLPEKEKSESEIKKIQERKDRLTEEANKMTEQEALSLVEKEANPPTEYQQIRISTTLSGLVPNRDWGIASEEYYIVTYSNVTGINFLVGKESKLVYSIANQGASPAHLMKDKAKIETYEYIGQQ